MSSEHSLLDTSFNPSASSARSTTPTVDGSASAANPFDDPAAGVGPPLDGDHESYGTAGDRNSNDSGTEEVREEEEEIDQGSDASGDRDASGETTETEDEDGEARDDVDEDRSASGETTETEDPDGDGPVDVEEDGDVWAEMAKTEDVEEGAAASLTNQASGASIPRSGGEETQGEGEGEGEGVEESVQREGTGVQGEVDNGNRRCELDFEPVSDDYLSPSSSRSSPPPSPPRCPSPAPEENEGGAAAVSTLPADREEVGQPPRRREYRRGHRYMPIGIAGRTRARLGRPFASRRRGPLTRSLLRAGEGSLLPGLE